MDSNVDPPLTHEEAMQRHEMLFDLHHALLKRWSELMLEELLRDKDTYRGKNAFDQAYSRASWDKKIDLIFKSMDVFERRYAGQRGELRLIEEKYGDRLNLPVAGIPGDLKDRMEWYKRRLANGFERDLKETINFHKVTSAIEQIFLMEWMFQGMERRHGLKLTPQKKITCGDKEYVVDFHITKPGSPMSICVELDGHDFHEKTREQVAKDKQREREIVAEGYTLLRFTGSEVFRNPADRVQEILEIVERRSAGSGSEQIG